MGSAIMNILCNGGPIAAAERIKTFLALHGLDPAEKRLLTIGFASGRFPFINVPYGIVSMIVLPFFRLSMFRPSWVMVSIW